MKYKVGDKVIVRSGLKKRHLFGLYLETYHRELEKKVFTITGFTNDGYYNVKETPFLLSDEMLEPVEEQFNVGDVVYDIYGGKAKIVDTSFVIKYENSSLRFIKRKNEITKKKPLTKITKERLAEMGYEVKE